MRDNTPRLLQNVTQCKDKVFIRFYNKTVPTYHKPERFRLVSFLTIYFIFQEQNNDEFVQRDLPISKNICCQLLRITKNEGHRALRHPSQTFIMRLASNSKITGQRYAKFYSFQLIV